MMQFVFLQRHMDQVYRKEQFQDNGNLHLIYSSTPYGLSSNYCRLHPQLPNYWLHILLFHKLLHKKVQFHAKYIGHKRLLLGV